MKTIQKITFLSTLLLLTTFCSSNAMEPLKKAAKKTKNYCKQLLGRKEPIELLQDVQPIIFEAVFKAVEEEPQDINKAIQSNAAAIYSITLVNQHGHQRYNNIESCITFIKKWAKAVKTSDSIIANMLNLPGFRLCVENQSMLFSACRNPFDEDLLPLHTFLKMKRNKTDFGFTYHPESPTTGLMLAIEVWAQDPITELIAIEEEKPGSININHQDNFGNTALLYCLQQADKKNCACILQKMLAAGANPTIANKQGITPLTVAQKTNNPVIMTLIEKSLTKSPF